MTSIKNGIAHVTMLKHLLPHPFATIFGNPFSLTTPVTSFLNDHLHNSIYLQVQTYALGKLNRK